MTIQSVILAGGKGTRLAERLGGLPKPLVMVSGVPLLQRQIESLISYGVNNIVILVNHKKEAIEEFVHKHDSFGVKIQIVDDGEPKGTAGALIAAAEYLEDEFLVVYGDTLFDIDLSRLINFHKDSQCDATLFVHPNDHPSDSDLIDVDAEQFIRGFFPYPHSDPEKVQNIVNAAMYVINRHALLTYTAGFETPSDLAKNVFPHMIKGGAKLKAYNSPEYIKDIGTPARLDIAEEQLVNGVVQSRSLRRKQKAVFIDRDGTLNVPNGHISKPEDIVFYDNIGRSVLKLQKAGYRNILVSNQPVVARGEATTKDIDKINAKLDFELSKDKTYLDAKYICFHHPDKGFQGEVSNLKIVCECRKPSPGLIFRARNDFNIDLSVSWFIGDSSADFGAAKNAGVVSIGVKTGDASIDERYEFKPDLLCEDFNAAADFICNDFPKLRDCIESQISALSRFRKLVLLDADPNLVNAAGIILDRDFGMVFSKTFVDEQTMEVVSNQNHLDLESVTLLGLLVNDRNRVVSDSDLGIVFFRKKQLRDGPHPSTEISLQIENMHSKEQKANDACQ